MNPLDRQVILKRVRRNLLWISLLVLVWLMCSAQAVAETLTERQQVFHAKNQPVALYRYQLSFSPMKTSPMKTGVQ